ncbi:carbon-nitrogen hydrolase family protein [Streptomyces sp. NPDC002012]|uniref:carbon-nitrogen hydrolase family protein n=1 Tax=Streptomyces sp. NPDC002012 TaxID=3154532 RepID=UPI003324931B
MGPAGRRSPQAVADLAGELGLWVVFGSIHPLTPPHRPHNSLYVVSDEGALAARYDKRYLSNTELSYLYTPGTEPLVFEVDGLRFGTALCIEANFPELFEQYEQMDVDCVLISVMVDDAARAALAPAYATLYNYWVSYSVPAQFGATARARWPPPGQLQSRQLARPADRRHQPGHTGRRHRHRPPPCPPLAPHRTGGPVRQPRRHRRPQKRHAHHLLTGGIRRDRRTVVVLRLTSNK